MNTVIERTILRGEGVADLKGCPNMTLCGRYCGALDVRKWKYCDDQTFRIYFRFFDFPDFFLELSAFCSMAENHDFPVISHQTHEIYKGN